MGWAKKGWMQHERSKWWPWCCIHCNSINTALFLTKTVYILKFNAKHKSSNQFTLYYLFEIWQQKSIHILKLISAQNGALLFWILHHIYYIVYNIKSSNIDSWNVGLYNFLISKQENSFFAIFTLTVLRCPSLLLWW